MDLKESIDFSWIPKMDNQEDQRPLNKDDLINKRNLLLKELMQQTPITPEKRERLMDNIKDLMHEINKVGKENEEENEFKTTQLQPGQEIIIETDDQEDFSTRMLPDVPEELEEEIVEEIIIEEDEEYEEELTEEEINDLFLVESFDQMFIDIWNEDPQIEKIKKMQAEINQRFVNYDDLRDSCQGYIDDHRMKSKIFLKTIEMLSKKTTDRTIGEKPHKLIVLPEGRLMKKLDDVLCNIYSMQIDEDRSIEEASQEIQDNIEEILGSIKKLSKNQEKIFHYWENYHFDLKTKMNFFYKTIQKICPKPLDIGFEPSKRLSEKEIKHMAIDFGFGKYLLDFISLQQELDKANQIEVKEEIITERPKVTPIDPDDERIKNIGNQTGKKVFYCFRPPDLFHKDRQ